MQALVVFEPRSGEVIGLFFSMPLHARRPSSDGALAESDPRVDEVALTVGAPPSVLGASLTLPRIHGDSRLPAILFVAGSGPQDRDETMQRAKPFRDLAFGLAARGIAGLRYDKRTFTYPAQFDRRRSSVEDEVISDAVLAAEVLKTRPEVDPTRVYVLGHSLGALLAPEIAKRSGGAAGLVLIAAPGRPVLEVIIEQIRSSGADPADIARLTQKAGALPALPPDEVLLGMPVRYWRDLDGRDEIATARELHRPILYVRGDRDRNISPEDQKHWDQGLRGQVPFEAVAMPELNHLLLPANADLGADVHVPGEVIERIADFVAGGDSLK